MADQPTYLSIECWKTEMAIEEAISEPTGKPPMFGPPKKFDEEAHELYYRPKFLKMLAGIEVTDRRH